MQLNLWSCKSAGGDVPHSAAEMTDSGQQHAPLFCFPSHPTTNLLLTVDGNAKIPAWTIILGWLIQRKAELKRLMMEFIKRPDTMSWTQMFITWRPSCQNSTAGSRCCRPGAARPALAAGWQPGSRPSLRPSGFGVFMVSQDVLGSALRV